jgi:hypothetical protein
VIEYFQVRHAPTALLEACEFYERRIRDGLFIQALTAWRIWREEAPQRLALARSGLEGHPLGGIPDYALDPLHTRLGRRAVELWLRSYMQKPPFGLGQVAAALWNYESALCCQTLFWDIGTEIQTAAYSVDLTAHGLPAERHCELQSWIAKEHSLLLAARDMVWRSHIRSQQARVSLAQ